MIQVGSYLNVIDNCGAQEVCCIKVSKGYRRRYAFIGDVVTVSIKSIRRSKRSTARIKKGDIVKALVVRIKAITLRKNFNEYIRFPRNDVLLINKQNKLIGTRIFGGMPKFIRSTKFLRLTSLSAGILK
jgi:large subunit ribosomal protein L14